ncbi:MAG: tryptophan synthase subunit alpha [Candidatus Bathyarchaeia archaeon]
MREIEKTFQNLREKGEGALIAYVTAGDPKPKHTPRIVEALINGGADIIELGIPFSDPIADGPTIQAATVRALKANTTPKMVLEITREIKEEHSVPIVILTYYNPVFKMGLEKFFALARRCKVDGIIVPDLPVEEAYDYKMVAEAHGIDTIFLAAPSTSKERLKKIVDYTSGFLYLVSIFGVTGAREKIQELTVRTINKFHPYTSGRIPLAVGFGISKPEHVKAVIESGAEGAIVGSAFVDVIKKNRGDVSKIFKEIKEKARKLKEATKEPLTR